MTRGVWKLLAASAAVVAAVIAPESPLAAQSVVGAQGAARPLSLEEALRIAVTQSERVTIAQAGVTRARGQQLQARSQYLPQVGASLSYTRTLASEFQGAFGGGQDTTSGPSLPPCDPYTSDPSLPLEERVRQLEGQLSCEDPDAGFGGIDFGDLPFGRENIWQAGLSFSQNLFAGGRIRAQNRIADAGRTAAEIALEQSRAQLALDITQAYYDAVLSDRLVGIAEATLQQAESTLGQVTLARQVGNQPEFELLRAQVARDNARPVLIQRQSERQLAYMRLKQLVNIPADQPVELTSDLGDEDVSPVARMASRMVGGETAAALDSALERTAVDQAEQAVRVQEGLLSVAEAQRLPNVVLSSQYGRVTYPESGIPDWTDSRPNWTVGVGLQVPIFSGGRIRGDRLVAEANLAEARAQLQQVRELASLDTRSAYQELASALASWQASQGTVEQASRAYQIADVRYREGISTQVELSDSRILLQQAQANRAMAARNLHVAQARVALLPSLPLGAGGGAAGAPASGGGAAPQQSAPQPPQPGGQQVPQQQARNASMNGTPGIGGQ